jgi:hypothetical protein
MIVILLVLVPSFAAADEDDYLPFYMPVPDGWRTETIPFPLDFAPELKYEGVEELRFSPWMFEGGRVSTNCRSTGTRSETASG